LPDPSIKFCWIDLAKCTRLIWPNELDQFCQMCWIEPARWAGLIWQWKIIDLIWGVSDIPYQTLPQNNKKYNKRGVSDIPYQMLPLNFRGVSDKLSLYCIGYCIQIIGWRIILSASCHNTVPKEQIWYHITQFGGYELAGTG
jgi:hypothetical protein